MGRMVGRVDLQRTRLMLFDPTESFDPVLWAVGNQPSIELGLASSR